MDKKDLKPCQLCGGSGVVMKSNGVDKEQNSVDVCPVCGGSGKVAESATSRHQHIHKYWGDMYFK